VGIGASVFLIAVGAIITFALNLRVGAVDLDIVGWILMGAGALGLIVSLIIWGNRRTTTTVDEDVAPPAP
jgi:hypothetical protein